MIRCLEFFAGIGAFAEATRQMERQGHAPFEIACAFDQNQWANLAYRHNFAHRVDARAIESLNAKDLREFGEIDLWWMSPPCQPYSRRGKQGDLDDPRAASLLRLVDLAREVQPTCIMIENVMGFRDSRALAHIKKALGEWYQFAEIEMCSFDWVPMKRPRYFTIATSRSLADFCPPSSTVAMLERPPLIDYIDTASHLDQALQIPQVTIDRYERVLNIIDPEDPTSYAICFTSNYQTCRTAGGSIIKHPHGHRFFSPDEMLPLFGFSRNFGFPSQITLANRYRLIGNSMDVRQVMRLLSLVSGRLAR